jgi:hypothetical protein
LPVGVQRLEVLTESHGARQAKILVEQQQPSSLIRRVHYLHFRGGYGQPYPAMILWAIVVDAVAASLWL